MASEPADLEDRELCPDGRCVGVIGDDGRCGECGISRDATPSDDPSARGDPVAVTDESESHDEAASDEDSDLDSRVLCADDTCVGIIGADGRCGTCGLAG